MANYGSRYEKKTPPYGAFAAAFVIVEYLAFAICGAITLEGTTPENFEEAVSYAALHPAVCVNNNTPIALLIGFVVWCMLVSYFIYYYRDFHMEEEHGDATWLEPEIANKELADSNERDNRIVSGHLKISLNGALANNNMLVMGSSGQYKTTSVMHQNLLQASGAYVVLDVKGDTQRKLGNAMKKLGYTVWSINFKNPEKSDHYNPFDYIETEDDLLRTVNALHQAARPKQEMSTGDPFWDDAVDLYLHALFSYVWLMEREPDGHHGTMNDVTMLVREEAQYSNEADEAGNPKTKLHVRMDELAARHGEDYLPVQKYYKLKKGAADTVASVILMINAMLSICDTAEVRRIFSGSDFDFRDLGRGVGGDPKKPVILFLVIPDNNKVYNWIMSMAYTQMFDILIRLADDYYHGPLPLRVQFHLDEFYAGAKPTDADELLGVVRSRNIEMIIYLQSVSQIKTLYKDTKWEIIMDNTPTVLFLGSGPAAHSTHEFISTLLDSATADSRDDNTHLGGNGGSGLNFKKTEIKLMRPNQVSRMPDTECIVFLSAHPPIYDEKAIPFDQPWKHFKAQKWLKERYKDALALGDYEHPVYTVYDAENLRYIDIEKKKKFQLFTEPDDIKALQEEAKKNPHMKEFVFDENEFLYISWPDGRKDDEQIKKDFLSAVSQEGWNESRYQGLSVFMDDGDVSRRPDKSKWKPDDFSQLVADYWDELSEEEKEELSLAMEEGLSEAQLAEIFLLPLEEMSVMRKAYAVQNEKAEQGNPG